MLKLLLPILLFSSALHAKVSVELAQQQGAVDRPFELVLEAEQRQPLPEPEFSVLEKDFSILNNSKISISNFRSGKTYYNSRWTLLLRPKQSGTLSIPPIRVGSERSRSLSYLATEQMPAEPPPNLFLTTQATPDLNYSRAAFLLSIKLYFREHLTSAQLTEPSLEGLRIERLGGQLNHEESVKGLDYQVVEQRYLLFPLTPGRYQLPPIHFSGASADGEKHFNVSSNITEFEAIPPPAEVNHQHWLAATELRLEQSWGSSLENLRVGDTLLRTLTIEAHNVPADWLPTPKATSQEGVSIYPQPPSASSNGETGTLVSRKEITYKILLTKAGQVRLPAIEIPWWDTIRDQYEVSRIQGTTITIGGFNQMITTPAPAAAKPEPKEIKSRAAPPSGISPSAPWLAWLWALIAIVCALGWTLTWSKLKRLSSTPLMPSPEESSHTALKQRDYALEETQAFNQLARACSLNDPQNCADSLIRWAKFNWPDESIGDLADFETQAGNPTLRYLLRDLEHHLYAPGDEDDPWHGDLIFKQVSRLRQKTKGSNDLSH